MNMILNDLLSITQYNNTKIKVLFNSDSIFENILSAPDITSSTPSKAESNKVFNFTYADIDYELRTTFNLIGIAYQLLSSNNNSNNITIETEACIDNSTFYSGFMPTYTPILKYTGNTAAIIESIENEANKTIMPLIDIRKDGDINNYLEYGYDNLHFLDLSVLEIMRNRVYRDSIKERRKKERGSPSRPELPGEEYTSATRGEILDLYIQISETTTIIPTIRIDTTYPANSDDIFYVNKMRENFTKVIIRVMGMDNFSININSYLLLLASILSDSYIIFEFNSIQEAKEVSVLNTIQNSEYSPQIIYAKETADFDSIKREHGDNYFENIALSGYLRLKQYNIENIWFADYCGYERDTATSYIPGMKPNAKLHLVDNKDAKKICIYKIKVEEERGTGKTKQSMIYLVDEYIRKDNINILYLDPNHCDACTELYNIESLSLAKSKSICMRHNGITIAKL